MKSALFATAVFAFSSAAMADDPDSKEAKSKAIEQSLKTFAGTWEIVTVQPPGGAQEAKKLVFRKDRTYAALDANDKELWAGTFDLDPTVTPKIWDHRSYESQEQGGDALGIYELDGDKLTLGCVVGVWNAKQWTGKPRPTEFKLPVVDAVLELRRVASGK